MSFQRLSVFILLFLVVFAHSAWSMPWGLQAIVAEIQSDADQGMIPIVVTDLDETIIDSTPRRYLSFRDSLRTICGDHRKDDCAKISGINLIDIFKQPNRYDDAELFRGIGIRSEMLISELAMQGTQFYLSGRHLEADQAIPGALEFVQALQDAGARIFYVSSRYQDTQLNGTLASLRELGFEATPSKENVILRPRDQDSLAFKKASFERIRSWAKENHASVKLVMENEPENMNAMMDTFPDAQAIFVEGAYLKGEKVRPQALKIRNFRE